MDVDFEKFKECVTNFSKNVNNYNDSIAEFFEFIDKNNSWLSSSSEEFKNIIMAKKKKYVEFGGNLIGFSELLNKTAEELALVEQKITGGKNG